MEVTSVGVITSCHSRLCPGPFYGIAYDKYMSDIDRDISDCQAEVFILSVAVNGCAPV